MKSFFTMTASVLALVRMASAGPIITTGDDSITTRGESITGMRYCGVFAAASRYDEIDLIDPLGQTAWSSTGYQGNQEWTIPASACYRVQCMNTSAVYVCNDNTSELVLKGKQIYPVAKMVTNNCCSAGSKQVAGQQFTQWGWNVVIGYGNCKHDVYQKPSTMNGFGINGDTCKPNDGMVGRK